MMQRLFIALVFAGAPGCFGQILANTHDELRSEAEQHIAVLHKGLNALMTPMLRERELQAACAVNCGTPDVQEGLHKATSTRMRAMDSLISQAHHEVDNWVASTADLARADLSRELIEQDLKKLLAPIIDGPPSAFVGRTAKSVSLIVFYGLHKAGLMGDGATSVTLRAYTPAKGGVELTAKAGDDLDGYGSLASRELRSPVADEEWLLIWGQMTGTGPNVRMRIYAYNGAKFRTVWAPDSVWGSFAVQVTEHGFTVDGDYHREPRERHDAYFVSRDGVYRAR